MRSRCGWATFPSLAVPI